MNALEVLQACTVQGNNVFLPEGQLDREIYKEVAKRLEGIGGKWNRKVGGFVFSTDPTDLLSEVQGGAVRNLKKEYQFFSTPPKLAEYLVEISYLEKGMRILEPSAGQGAILDAIIKTNKIDNKDISCVELMPENFKVLQDKYQQIAMIQGDFLELSAIGYTSFHNIFDRIIANPPFAKNQDIDHIKAMYLSCKKGGMVVSVASRHWQNSTNRKEIEFREWLDNLGAEIIDIEAGEFKESGTNVATCIVVINKK